MEQLPKIVQQRLQSGAKFGVHPDPDLLTAFAERSLDERERAEVLQHLGQCMDCRTIVSLAMPEIAAPSTAPAIPARSRWLSWPVLRWGALGVCVLVVGTAVTLHYDRQYEVRQHEPKSDGQPERQATGASSSANVATVPEPSTNLALQHPASIQPTQKLAEKISPPSLFKSDRAFDSVGKVAKQRDDSSAGARARSAGPAIGGAEARRQESQPLENGVQQAGRPGNTQLADSGHATADALKPLDKPPAQAAGNFASGAPAAPPAPESKAVSAEEQTRELSDKAGVEKDEKKRSENAKNEKEGSENLDGVPRGSTETVTVTAEAPVIQAETAEVASARGKSGKKVKNKAQHLSASDNTGVRWTLSSNGALQRSLDSGKTWQPIPVASNVVFRALAANDSDIWVGGASGALYHSADGGEHWTQVSPAAGGEVLMADIVGVEFTDSRNGKVITSTRESWSTSDGGATWHRD
jgi:hypothetical protein